MSIEINRIKWKCRRGMRELDLLLREFAAENLEKLDETNLKILDEVLDYDDQSLFDYIFKNISLSNYEHEDFIDKFLKKGGSALIKVFQGESLDYTRKALSDRFKTCKVNKPSASRSNSKETYIIGKEFK